MSKSQSAMEYLMTYGWAILIIAVVLGAIYSLGLFNGATLAPRAQPGSCEVLRPNGALTTQYISLAGSCTNELPQYVAQFNGGNSYIGTGTSGFPIGNSPRSIFLWVNPTTTINDANYHDPFGYGSTTGSNSLSSFIRIKNLGSGAVMGFNPGSGSVLSSLPVTPNNWEFIGYTFDGSNVIVYVNSNQQTIIGPTTINTVIPVTLPSTIGSESAGDGLYFPGQIANVQIYNSSLDSNSIKALYQEGIGGAPINLQTLVGWWPLNGNSNDYSGNLNNGQATMVTYTNQWLNGYTVP